MAALLRPWAMSARISRSRSVSSRSGEPSRWARAVDERVDDHRVDVRAAAGDLADGPGQLGGVAQPVLEQVGAAGRRRRRTAPARRSARCAELSTTTPTGGRLRAQVAGDADALVGAASAACGCRSGRRRGACSAIGRAQRGGVRGTWPPPRCPRCDRACAMIPSRTTTLSSPTTTRMAIGDTLSRGDPAAHDGPVVRATRRSSSSPPDGADAVVHAHAARRRPGSAPGRSRRRRRRPRTRAARPPTSSVTPISTPAPPCLIAFWIASRAREVDGGQSRRRAPDAFADDSTRTRHGRGDRERPQRRRPAPRSRRTGG